ncbi:DUF58 domain-containing protein [Candidatus Uabimicrobium sp. HlEnr_7]|uniref:DUF58 domain-containing protein n=1 Tax=Candidatus Uabimicrobium helgolandensis TaxID=3095367 RepID=UPI0035575C7F
MQLRLLIKKNLGTADHGNISSKFRGTGNDFDDHSPYNPGDDFKDIDWNIYARTEQLFVKKYLQAKYFSLTIFIDLSASMLCGKPSKSSAAKRLAAGLAYLFLHNGCSIQIGIVQNNHILYSKQYRHYKYIKDILNFLSRQKPQGQQNLKTAIKKITKKSQLCILCSDFLHAKDSFAFIQQLAIKNKCLLLHILSREEVTTPFNGKLVLEDIENREKITINIDNDVRKKYLKEVQDFRQNWQSFATRNRIPYYFTLNDKSIARTIVNSLQMAKFLSTD